MRVTAVKTKKCETRKVTKMILFTDSVSMAHVKNRLFALMIRHFVSIQSLAAQCN